MMGKRMEHYLDAYFGPSIEYIGPLLRGKGGVCILPIFFLYSTKKSTTPVAQALDLPIESLFFLSPVEKY